MEKKRTGSVVQAIPLPKTKDLIFQACFTSSAWLNKKGYHMYSLMSAARELFQGGPERLFQVSGLPHTRLGCPGYEV